MVRIRPGTAPGSRVHLHVHAHSNAGHERWPLYKCEALARKPTHDYCVLSNSQHHCEKSSVALDTAHVAEVQTRACYISKDSTAGRHERAGCCVTLVRTL
jgi:hypothetical protein